MATTGTSHSIKVDYLPERKLSPEQKPEIKRFYKVAALLELFSNSPDIEEVAKELLLKADTPLGRAQIIFNSKTNPKSGKIKLQNFEELVVQQNLITDPESRKITIIVNPDPDVTNGEIYIPDDKTANQHQTVKKLELDLRQENDQLHLKAILKSLISIDKGKRWNISTLACNLSADLKHYFPRGSIVRFSKEAAQHKVAIYPDLYTAVRATHHQERSYTTEQHALDDLYNEYQKINQKLQIWPQLSEEQRNDLIDQSKEIFDQTDELLQKARNLFKRNAFLLIERTISLASQYTNRHGTKIQKLNPNAKILQYHAAISRVENRLKETSSIQSLNIKDRERLNAYHQDFDFLLEQAIDLASDSRDELRIKNFISAEKLKIYPNPLCRYHSFILKALADRQQHSALQSKFENLSNHLFLERTMNLVILALSSEQPLTTAQQILKKSAGKLQDFIYRYTEINDIFIKINMAEELNKSEITDVLDSLKEILLKHSKGRNGTVTKKTWQD